jgi:uncharacterized protein
VPHASVRHLSLATARRVAVAAQRLAERPAASSPNAVIDVARSLRCIQVDPISAVAPTQQLVLASRLQGFERSNLDEVLWGRKQLFHYWAHAASLVLTEDFPLHARRMRSFGRGDDNRSRWVREWMKDNAALRRHILKRIRAEGPLRSRDLEDRSRRSWESSGWTANQNVSRMLDLMWARGELMIVGRQGLQRIWDLTERWLPDWAPQDRLTEPQAVERAAAHAMRALGVATPRHVSEHFTRGYYSNLPRALARLERRGEIEPVEVEGPGRDPWYLHREARQWLNGGSAGSEPRTVLLSPFDNLICDRRRTRRLFDFDYSIEIYVPKAKRKYGYYVLPILHGDRLIGRLDAALDRKKGVFRVHSLYNEPGAPLDAATGGEVGKAIRGLAQFTQASDVALPARLPRGWARPLRSL